MKYLYSGSKASAVEASYRCAIKIFLNMLCLKKILHNWMSRQVYIFINKQNTTTDIWAAVSIDTGTDQG